jgi:hypothetical protein
MILESRQIHWRLLYRGEEIPLVQIKARPAPLHEDVLQDLRRPRLYNIKVLNIYL